LKFTSAAMTDINKISGRVTEFLDLVTKGIQHHDENFMIEADSLENSIDHMREKMRQDHISRLQSADCSLEPGLVFIDMLTNFEKIGDYCFNIAEAVAGLK